MNEKRTALAVTCTLIILAVALRLLPHPANFAPVAAVSIFGGAMLPRKLAIWVPLAAMAASDLIIGFYEIMPVIWGCYLLIALASSLWIRRSNLVKVAALTIAGSIFFFIVTNFAVWASTDMYTHMWSGLVQCYIAALPFFRNTFLSDLFYTGLLFGLFELSRMPARKLTYTNTRDM